MAALTALEPVVAYHREQPQEAGGAWYEAFFVGAVNPSHPTLEGFSIPQVGRFLAPKVICILFWTSAVVLGHRFHRPVVGAVEIHGVVDIPGGYSAVVLFDFKAITRPNGLFKFGGVFKVVVGISKR